jgi:hypothetical protein
MSSAPSPDWRLMRDRVAEFYKTQIDEGFAPALVGDVLLSAGVYVIHESIGREQLVQHLENLAEKISDPDFEFGGEFLQ